MRRIKVDATHMTTETLRKEATEMGLANANYKSRRFLIRWLDYAGN